MGLAGVATVCPSVGNHANARSLFQSEICGNEQ